MPEASYPGLPNAAARPTAPYGRGTPATPYVHVPLQLTETTAITPSTEHIAIFQMSKPQFATLTDNGRPCEAGAGEWTYAKRRCAQSIVDWLWLGPASTCRDASFLEREGITMVLAVRHLMNQGRQNPTALVTSTAATRALGIPFEPIDVTNTYQLANIFKDSISKINNHVLSASTDQPAPNQSANGQRNVPSNGSPRRGRVLVVCETGNDRSASIVAAYLMAMFDIGFAKAHTFVNMRRFSATFDDDAKILLQAWQDILTANKLVSQSAQNLTVPGWQPGGGGTSRPTTMRKRSIDDMSGNEGGGDEDDSAPSPDGSRAFTPFVDRDVEMA